MPTNTYNPTVAFVLAVLLGYLGIDRFYTRQVGLGVAKLLTVGGFGLWWIVDIIVFGAQALSSSNRSNGRQQPNAVSTATGGAHSRTAGTAAEPEHTPPAPRGQGIEPWTRSSTMTEVVGEYYRPGTYEQLFRGMPADGSWSRFEKMASLYPDPHNPHGSGHAVAVWIEGSHAGFLASGNSGRYFGVLDQLARRGQHLVPRVKVAGRYDARKRQWIAEVQLDLPEPELILPRNTFPSTEHVLIPAGRTIQVTEEAKYMDALGPLTDGTAIPYAATLHAIHEVKPRSAFETVEIRIDGQAVGILSKATAEKILPLVELIERRGLVAVARAKVTGNSLGADVTLNMIRASEAEAAWLASVEQRQPVERSVADDHKTD